MSPKEKAKELYRKMDEYTHGYVGSSMLSNTEFDEEKIKRTKKAALIIATELADECNKYFEAISQNRVNYWVAVKAEIENL